MVRSPLCTNIYEKDEGANESRNWCTEEHRKEEEGERFRVSEKEYKEG